MRSAHTAARGIMHRHERRHHHRHQDLHQVAEERGQRADLQQPSAIRWPPNHSTATLDALNTSITVGNISACSLPTCSAVAVRSSFAPCEARGLRRLAHERAHHPHAGDLLAQHAVDGVDAAAA